MKFVKQFTVNLSPSQAKRVRRQLKGLKPGYVVFAQTRTQDGSASNPHIKFDVADQEFATVASSVLASLKRTLIESTD